LHLGTVQVVEPVFAWIRTHQQGRSVVEKALTSTGDRRVAARLIARLQERDPDLVREATIQALLWEGDVSAWEPLVACLRDAADAMYAADEAVEVRAMVVAALGRLGDARAVEPLRVCRQDPAQKVRQADRQALEALGDEVQEGSGDMKRSVE
jgi:HEAT repeat protein